MRTLIAIDGSEHSTRVVDFITRHPHLLGDRAEVTVLCVATPPPLQVVSALGSGGAAPLPIEVAQAAEPALTALKEAGIEGSLVERVGDAALEIAQLATDGNYDLVVMGSHGRGLLKRAVLGSVAHKLLGRCSVPVLIVR